jgi:hypothetical protein
MSKLSFFKKPFVFALLLMLTTTVITRLSTIFYLSADSKYALVFNIFIEFSIEIVKLALISFFIVKLFQARLTEKFIKTVTYYIAYVFSAICIAVPIVLIGLNALLAKTGTIAEWISAYFNTIGGLPASIAKVKQMPGGTIPSLILIIVLIGIMLAVFTALYFYLLLRISNKIAARFVDKQ